VVIRAPRVDNSIIVQRLIFGRWHTDAVSRAAAAALLGFLKTLSSRFAKTERQKGTHWGSTVEHGDRCRRDVPPRPQSVILELLSYIGGLGLTGRSHAANDPSGVSANRTLLLLRRSRSGALCRLRTPRTQVRCHTEASQCDPWYPSLRPCGLRGRPFQHVLDRRCVPLSTTSRGHTPSVQRICDVS